MLKSVASGLFSIGRGLFVASIALRMRFGRFGHSCPSERFYSSIASLWSVSALQIFNRMLASLSTCVYSREIRPLGGLVDWLSFPSSEGIFSHIFLLLLSSYHSLGFVMADCGSGLVLVDCLSLCGVPHWDSRLFRLWSGRNFLFTVLEFYSISVLLCSTLADSLGLSVF